MSDRIEARRLRFCFPSLLPYWNGDCPVKTHLFNAIAMITPAFERLAISSVLPWQKHITAPLLKEQIKGFVSQESAHGSAFIRFNQLLAKQGYAVKPRARTTLQRFQWVANKVSPKMHLSFTLAAEHLTAILSDLFLRESHWLEKAEPTCAALWRWHAIEEIEHKAVAFDLYETLKGGYFRRIVGMIIITLWLSGALLSHFWYLVFQDNAWRKRGFWRKYWQVFWGRSGVFCKIFLPYWRYYLPSFHPWHYNNQTLLEAWKKQIAASLPLEEVISALQKIPWLAEGK